MESLDFHAALKLIDRSCSTLKGTADLTMKTSRPVNELKDMIPSQPLHEKEQELRSILREALYKTLNELRTISNKMTQ